MRLTTIPWHQQLIVDLSGCLKHLLFEPHHLRAGIRGVELKRYPCSTHLSQAG
jgi:hypothetical protein